MGFILLISLVIFLRIGEIILSRKNEQWLIQNGAVEYGEKHYLFIVLLHVLFIMAMLIEYAIRQTATFSLFFLVLYLF